MLLHGNWRAHLGGSNSVLSHTWDQLSISLRHLTKERNKRQKKRHFGFQSQNLQAILCQHSQLVDYSFGVVPTQLLCCRSHSVLAVLIKHLVGLYCDEISCFCVKKQDLTNLQSEQLGGRRWLPLALILILHATPESLLERFALPSRESWSQRLIVFKLRQVLHDTWHTRMSFTSCKNARSSPVQTHIPVRRFRSALNVAGDGAGRNGRTSGSLTAISIVGSTSLVVRINLGP